MTKPNQELLLGPILGGLSAQGVNLWARAAKPDIEPVRLHAWIGLRPDLSDAVLSGTSMPLSAAQGYAGVVPVRGLISNTIYHYALTLANTPPLKGAGPVENGAYPSFKTFSEAGKPASFNFAFGSCFRPLNETSGQIFDTMNERRLKDDLRFMVLLGDQIYADDYHTNSLGKVAETLDEYRSVYQHCWTYETLRRLFWQLPAFMTLDDHEVDDDWRWLDAERRRPYIPWWDSVERFFGGRPPTERFITPERVRAALQAYWEHQGMHAPPLVETPGLDGVGGYQMAKGDPGSLAYTFECGLAAFFVLDTRSMRVRPLGHGEKMMLGTGQWEHLKRWFLRVKDLYPVKFLVSSCSLLFSSWLDIPQDRWSGYATERDRLLHFLANHGIEGVYVLSGDFHFGFAIHAELYGPDGVSSPIWEFCSSPFDQSPSRLAAITRRKIRTGLIKRQECKFKVMANNFGVVRVAIRGDSTPRVVFELYGEDGSLLGQAGE